jgi:ABC-2 type transport system permease protein
VILDKIRLIIAREFLSRVKKKSFIIMTLLGPLLIGGFIASAVYVGTSTQKGYDVLVIDEFGYLPVKLKDSKEAKFQYSNTDISDAQFIASDFDVMLVIHEKIIQNTSIQMYHKGIPRSNVQGYIASQIARSLEQYKLADQGIDSETFHRIKTFVTLLPIDIETYKEDGHKQYSPVVGMILGIVIFMFIFMYGVQVMRGVIEEKTNRVVEVLISSVTPFQLMLGKIVGIAFVGFTQFIMWIILTMTIVVSMSALAPDIYDPANAASTIEITPEVAKEFADMNLAQTREVNEIRELVFNHIDWPVVLSSFLFYFLFGYLLYAALFAAIGSAVDNETDTQQFVLPISAPLMFAYILGIFLIENPDGAAATWFSIIPFTSPVTMMMRVSSGFDAGGIWQLWLSMGLLILTFLLTTWFAGKIYRTGILMYGKKASYQELWKWLFYR